MNRISLKRKRKQNKRRNLRMEPLEHRLCLAASLGWDGPGQGAASLSYYIGDVPASVELEQVEVESALETALDAWADVADVTFTRTTLARQSDSLDITFASIDGTGRMLAQAYLPDDVNRGRLAGDIEFDLADPWETGNDAGRAAFDLVYVAVHEIGHALGLDHLNVVGSVMRPSVSPGPSQVFTALSTADVNEILGVYAAAPRVTTDTENTETGNSDGGDIADDASSPNDNNSNDDEQPRQRREGRRGRFGGWRGRSGRATIEVLTAAPSHHNSERPTDVNDDQTVSAIDALTIINDLNKRGSRSLSLGEGEAGSSFSMVDVNGDESVTALDALMVVNELNLSTPLSIAIEDPVAEEMITDGDTTTDEEASTEETDTTIDEDPVDDAATEMGDTDSGDETETEEEMDDPEVAGEDETDMESDDETMVDDGPLEEEHHGCHRGRRNPFVRLDANEDGLLTVDELAEARASASEGHSHLRRHRGCRFR
jgi:hypothetical protein